MKVLDRLLTNRKTRSLVAHETLRTPAAVHFVLLVYSITATVDSTFSQGSVVFAELHGFAMLTADYPAEESNPIREMEWKKKIKESTDKLLLMHKMPDETKNFGCDNRCSFTNQTLILHNVTEEDEGVYEISLLLANSSMIIKNITLITYLPPHISISSDNSTDSGLKFRCQLGPGALRSYTWLKDGQALPQDGRHSLSEGNATLLVRNLSSEDCGNYSCEAHSGASRRQAHIQLSVSVLGPNLTYRESLLRDIIKLCPASTKTSSDSPSQSGIMEYMLANPTIFGITVVSAATASIFTVAFFIMKLRKRQRSTGNSNTIYQDNHIYEDITDIQAFGGLEHILETLGVNQATPRMQHQSVTVCLVNYFLLT
ncbi:pregnancy-specific beta-1-glycoprotein 2 isoform X2 [Scleropages formosus]|uniref:pregnancy-specific beta-1-glycoprotein 2 isoform X2 n=1 Tax=Scleropages formosus TaxID=113540 RepID=UPI000877FBB3|nr:pregnancy-specific beta-1-glycoprotein 2-like isoform X2 [Scleropages formosus]